MNVWMKKGSSKEKVEKDLNLYQRRKKAQFVPTTKRDFVDLSRCFYATLHILADT